MEINASNRSSASFIDNELEAYDHGGIFGLLNHNNGKKVLPYLNSIITTDKFVLFQVGDKWGIMDRELCLIIPPIYDTIYAIRITNTDAIFERCKQNLSGIDVKIDLNTPQHIVFKKDFKVMIGGRKYSHSAYDIIDPNIDHADLFIAINKNAGCILKENGNKIEIESYISRSSLYWLWHYKSNMFIISEDLKYYGISFYNNISFNIVNIVKGADCHRQLLSQCEMEDISFLPYSIQYCPNINFYKNDFISICLPTIENNDGSIINLSGRWALYRFIKEEDCEELVYRGFMQSRIIKYKSRLQQMTPFVLEKAPVQIYDGFKFICRANNKDFVIKYDCKNKIDASSISFSNQSTILANGGSSLVPKHLFEDFWNISSFHDKIELRGDGLLCVSDGSFYGLLDKNLKELVPINYDYPIEISKQLNIVCRNGLKGVINSKGELIVPCIYSYIQISKDNLEIYHKDYDYDEEEKESVEDNYLVDKGIPRDAKLSDEDYIIAGINSENEKEREKKREKEKEIEKLSGVLAAFFRTEHDPRYAPNARVDLFLPNGQQLTSCVIETDGNIQFNHKCGCVLIRTCKTNAYIYYINTKKETIRYSQIQIINSNSFMVYQDYRVGILSINENVEDSDVWIVPCVYSRMTKINNFLFGLKRQEDKKILDVLDVLDNYSVVFSTDFDFPENLITERLRKFLLDDAPKELQDRIFKDGYLDFFNWFPVEEYYPKDEPSYNYDPYESYSTYDSLMDGLDGEPDAYWNIK